MASIYQRKNKDGTKVWRAVIRIKGHPSVSNHFERKQEAQDWATQVERDIRLGQFKFDQFNKLQTFDELVDRFLQDGSLEHHKSQQDTPLCQRSCRFLAKLKDPVKHADKIYKKV